MSSSHATPTSTAPLATTGTVTNTEGITNPNVTAPTDASGIAQQPVPERADAQQAATGPGTGTVEVGGTVPFKEQAHGYAKKFHGMFTGNKEEKEFGDQKIKGETPEQRQEYTEEAQAKAAEQLQPRGSDHVVPESARHENSTPSA